MALTLDSHSAAPTTKADRYLVMDVLRGFALLGVMTINLYEFGGVDVLITAEQLAALPSAALDERLQFWVKLLVYDKANTLFAFLFGLGFWVQMERLQARGAPFRSIYLRRAAILMFRRWLWPLLVAGLLLESVHLFTENMAETALLGQIELLRIVLHAVATPLIAAGYICAIVLLFHGGWLSWLVRPFAPVGQMALTNYLTQSVAIILILTSVGPGLGLAGNAAISTFLPLVLTFFAAQIVFSHFWMKFFAFGPAEWLWRTLTYGASPRMRRSKSLRQETKKGELV